MKLKSKGTLIRLIVIIVIIAALYILPFTPMGTKNFYRIALRIALYCTLGQMWNLMSGYTGMTSLGHQIFIGLAGYAMAVITATYGLPFWLALILGGVFAVIIAVLLSLLLFRMKGMYFAIATWVTAEALRIIFTSWKYVKQGAGMTVKAKPYPSSQMIYFMAITLAIIAIIVVFLVLKSRIGLGLTAMRDDPDAAASIGVNIFSSKLICFMISAFFTGLAGGLFYLNQGSIFPSDGFGSSWTIAAVFTVIIGGIGTITGPILGAGIYVILSEALSKYPGYSMIILGAIAIIVILFMPNGIIGTLERKFNFELISARRISRESHEEKPPEELPKSP